MGGIEHMDFFVDRAVEGLSFATSGQPRGGRLNRGTQKKIKPNQSIEAAKRKAEQTARRTAEQAKWRKYKKTHGWGNAQVRKEKRLEDRKRHLIAEYKAHPQWKKIPRNRWMYEKTPDFMEWIRKRKELMDDSKDDPHFEEYRNGFLGINPKEIDWSVLHPRDVGVLRPGFDPGSDS